MTKLVKAILYRNQKGVTLAEGLGFTSDGNTVKIFKNSKIMIVGFSTYDNTIQIRSEHNNTVISAYVSYSYITEKCHMNTEEEHRIDSIFVYREVSVANWLRELVTPMSLSIISNIMLIVALMLLCGTK